MSVFKTAANKRLKQKKMHQEQASIAEGASGITRNESEVMLEQIMAMIPVAEQAVATDKDTVCSELKSLHTEQEEILVKQRITGPCG
jgi:hypothetical protein